MSNVLYFLVMFTWVVYIVQESFITGSSALNIIAKDEGERKQIQVATGLHWDGIEVWFVVAVALTFAAFPLAFAVTFEFLYIPVFLLLYALITRGISIEVLYKLDNKKWVKAIKYAWSISSIIIIFILGVYLTNIFVGFPYDGVEMTSSFLSIFSVTTISAGIMFVAISFVAGAGWIYMTTSGEIGQKALDFVKKTGLIIMVPIFLCLTFMGLANEDTSIFIGELFSKSFLFFLLPLGAAASAVAVMIAGYKQKGKAMFVLSMVTIGLFVVMGFVGAFPYLVPSKIAFEHGISIAEATAQVGSLKILIVTISVFYPIVAFYQGWKYTRFSKKVNYNDELEG